MSEPAVVFFMGPPGSGKGTQAAAVAERVGATVVATSQVLSEMLESGVSGSARERITAAINRGILAPPALFADALLRVVFRKLNEGSLVFVDGSPRTLREADMLIKGLEEHGVRWRTVILDAPKPVTVHRVLNRWVCAQCRTAVSAPEKPAACPACGGAMTRRPDDTPDTIERRWEQYEFRTAPVLDWMRRRNAVIMIDGNQPIPAVTAAVVPLLQEFLSARPS